MLFLWKHRQAISLPLGLLVSRASSMSPIYCITCELCQWSPRKPSKRYFTAQLDLDETIRQVQNPGITRLKSTLQKSLTTALDRWMAWCNMIVFVRLRYIFSAGAKPPKDGTCAFTWRQSSNPCIGLFGTKLWTAISWDKNINTISKRSLETTMLSSFLVSRWDCAHRSQW